jgi:hypothetical protein
VNRGRLHAEFVVRFEIEFLSPVLVLGLYFAEKAVQVDQLLLLHGQQSLATEGLKLWLECRYHDHWL